MEATYRRPGFNCESLINANCDFSLKVQLLEHNYYYAMIDSVHVTHVLMLLAAAIEDEHLTLLQACYPDNTFRFLTRQECWPASPWR